MSLTPTKCVTYPSPPLKKGFWEANVLTIVDFHSVCNNVLRSVGNSWSKCFGYPVAIKK